MSLHGDLLQQASGFGALPAHLRPVVGRDFPVELALVAKAFVDLQEARHAADYDLTKRLTRGNARSLVEQAHDAFLAWDAVKGHRAARACLISLLLDSRWRGRD